MNWNRVTQLLGRDFSEGRKGKQFNRSEVGRRREGDLLFRDISLRFAVGIKRRLLDPEEQQETAFAAPGKKVVDVLGIPR
jgi:hypothetical protein